MHRGEKDVRTQQFEVTLSPFQLVEAHVCLDR